MSACRAIKTLRGKKVRVHAPGARPHQPVCITSRDTSKLERGSRENYNKLRDARGSPAVTCSGLRAVQMTTPIITTTMAITNKERTRLAPSLPPCVRVSVRPPSVGGGGRSAEVRRGNMVDIYRLTCPCSLPSPRLRRPPPRSCAPTDRKSVV